MKVICIDASGQDITDDVPIVEGNTYEVEIVFNGKFTGRLFYGLAGYAWVEGLIGHLAKRFAPISDIDEKEFERNYNKQTA